MNQIIILCDSINLYAKKMETNLWAGAGAKGASVTSSNPVSRLWV